MNGQKPPRDEDLEVLHVREPRRDAAADLALLIYRCYRSNSRRFALSVGDELRIWRGLAERALACRAGASASYRISPNLRPPLFQMSNSAALRRNGGRTLVYQMKPSRRGKNTRSKIQFPRQPTAAFAVANRVIYTHRGERDLRGIRLPTAAGAGAKTSKSPDADAAQRWRVQVQFSLEAALTLLVKLS